MSKSNDSPPAVTGRECTSEAGSIRALLARIKKTCSFGRRRLKSVLKVRSSRKTV